MGQKLLRSRKRQVEEKHLGSAGGGLSFESGSVPNCRRTGKVSSVR